MEYLSNSITVVYNICLYVPVRTFSSSGNSPLVDILQQWTFSSGYSPVGDMGMFVGY